MCHAGKEDAAHELPLRLLPRASIPPTTPTRPCNASHHRDPTSHHDDSLHHHPRARPRRLPRSKHQDRKRRTAGTACRGRACWFSAHDAGADVRRAHPPCQGPYRPAWDSYQNKTRTTIPNNTAQLARQPLQQKQRILLAACVCSGKLRTRMLGLTDHQHSGHAV